MSASAAISHRHHSLILYVFPTVRNESYVAGLIQSWKLGVSVRRSTSSMSTWSGWRRAHPVINTCAMHPRRKLQRGSYRFEHNIWNSLKFGTVIQVPSTCSLRSRRPVHFCTRSLAETDVAGEKENRFSLVLTTQNIWGRKTWVFCCNTADPGPAYLCCGVDSRDKIAHTHLMRKEM
jgi:hypothetical protein